MAATSSPGGARAAGSYDTTDDRYTRMPIGTLLTVLGAAGLVASLFIDWISDPDGEEALSGYQSSEVGTLLAYLAIGFAVAAIIATANRTWRATGTALKLVSLAAALAAVIYTVSYMVDPVGPIGEGEVDTESGVYVAIAGSAAWLLGAIVGMLEAVRDNRDRT
jgi:hypothetical protein